MNEQTQKLSNLQMELLRFFSMNLSEKDLLEIKNIIIRYLADKTIEEADRLWEEKGYTEQEAHRITNTHLRTPYNN